MNTNPNQGKRIVAYIRACGSITALEALNAIGCLNLKARIHELRSLGWGIHTTMIKTSTGKLVASYALTDPAQNEPTGVPIPGRKQTGTFAGKLAALEHEVEHMRAGKDWKQGAKWVLEKINNM